MIFLEISIYRLPNFYMYIWQHLDCLLPGAEKLYLTLSLSIFASFIHCSSHIPFGFGFDSPHLAVSSEQAISCPLPFSSLLFNLMFPLFYSPLCALAGPSHSHHRNRAAALHNRSRLSCPLKEGRGDESKTKAQRPRQLSEWNIGWQPLSWQIMYCLHAH